jgi:hypothetical protein
MPGVTAAKLSPLLNRYIVDNRRLIGTMASLDVPFSLPLGWVLPIRAITDQDERAGSVYGDQAAAQRVRDGSGRRFTGRQAAAPIPRPHSRTPGPRRPGQRLPARQSRMRLHHVGPVPDLERFVRRSEHLVLHGPLAGLPLHVAEALCHGWAGPATCLRERQEHSTLGSDRANH